MSRIKTIGSKRRTRKRKGAIAFSKAVPYKAVSY